MAKRTRLVVVTDDFLDGITAAEVQKPDEFTGPTARRIPVEAIDAYNAAWAAMRDAEKRLWKAWGDAKDVPNPHHIEVEEVQG